MTPRTLVDFFRIAESFNKPDLLLVKKDGACINISDTTLRGACLEHQPGVETRTMSAPRCTASRASASRSVIRRR